MAMIDKYLESNEVDDDNNKQRVDDPKRNGSNSKLVSEMQRDKHNYCQETVCDHEHNGGEPPVGS